MECDHDKRFKGVLFATNGCLACELEKMISENERLGLRIEELEEYIKLITKKSGIWVKELERERDVLKFSFNEMLNVASDQTEAYRGEQKKVKEFKDGIEKYLDDPEFNTEILSELIKKEKELPQGKRHFSSMDGNS